MSAFFIKAWGVVPSSGKVAMPMLGEISSWEPPMTNGRSKAATTR
jgi:hypothetical protein